ncbi:hypothetical protein [Halomarina oriensis]|uniref:DUF8098 domain-containing protein n=1 Tax=Halomarina oriensis TaxID=671145 RepID=A0A6B0GVR3_9EURY|nr:hypothetical protein [Halomarina oriensis]MWG36673.1 hypothetical protein [Halomarina oriensis]
MNYHTTSKMSFSYFECASEPGINTVRDMHDGLELALGEEEVSFEDTVQDDDRVIGVDPGLLWVNKAVYRATREMPNNSELPVLYTWFRYGPSVPIPAFLTSNITPKTLGRYARDEYESREHSMFSPYEFMHFFRNLIRQDSYFSSEISLTEFLLDLYHSDAPTAFRSLYELNVKTQQLLADLKSITEATPMTDERVNQYWENFEEVHNRFRSALYRAERISEAAADHVLSFMHLVKMVLEWLKGQDFLDPSSVAPINRLWSTYQANVWTWPAHWMSYETNDGEKPAGEAFRTYTRDSIDVKKNTWEEELRNFRDQLRQQEIIGAEATNNTVDLNGDAVTQIDAAILDTTGQISTE